MHTLTEVHRPLPALLTIPEAAEMLRISRSTTYQLISAGDIEVVHIGRSARVPVNAIDDYVQRLRNASRGGVAAAP